MFAPANATREFDALDTFLTAVVAAGAKQVILAVRDEWGPQPRPTQAEPQAIYFGPVRELTLLAYASGTLLRCHLSGEAIDVASIEAQVRAAGLEPKKRERGLM